MHDVVASLPLADDIREALVQRRGRMGQLLDCVVSLEMGEDDPVQATLPRAGELYLEALMWATSAAESLFGEPGAGPVRSAAPERPPVRRFANAAASSKAPPGAAPAGLALPIAATVEVGFFARLWAGLRGRFGRRVSAARS
jgi:hypothetical protein